MSWLLCLALVSAAVTGLAVLVLSRGGFNTPDDDEVDGQGRWVHEDRGDR